MCCSSSSPVLIGSEGSLAGRRQKGVRIWNVHSTFSEEGLLLTGEEEGEEDGDEASY